MFSLPASIKIIGSKTSKKEQRHHFLHFKYMGVFLKLNSRTDNSMVGGPIWPKFELILDFVKVHRVANSNRRKMASSIFRRSRAANSVFRGQIWPNIELTKALMYVIVTCKYEKDPTNNGYSFFPIISLWEFFSGAQGQLTP